MTKLSNEDVGIIMPKNFKKITPKYTYDRSAAEEAYNIYKEKYEQFYNEQRRKFIENHFFRDIEKKESADILMQLYSELGLDEGRVTFYNAHIEKLKSIFGLDRDIVEVGAGFIPAVANKIATYQLLINKGTITIYEPHLLYHKSKYPNMVIHKEKFTEKTIINKNALGIGILPCEATEVIFRNFCKNKMDFYIALCDCEHYLGQKTFIDLARHLTKDDDNATLKIETLGPEFHYDCPILCLKHHQ